MASASHRRHIVVAVIALWLVGSARRQPQRNLGLEPAASSRAKYRHARIVRVGVNAIKRNAWLQRPWRNRNLENIGMCDI